MRDLKGAFCRPYLAPSEYETSNIGYEISHVPSAPIVNRFDMHFRFYVIDGSVVRHRQFRLGFEQTTIARKRRDTRPSQCN
jgi:hypothetical protein